MGCQAELPCTLILAEAGCQAGVPGTYYFENAACGCLSGLGIDLLMQYLG